MTNRTDSRQLAELRFQFHRAAHQRGQARQATALRLGAYARTERIAITDFGAHSRRWIALFRRGWEWKQKTT